MPSLTFHTVDAFTTKPFSGNPAAVIVLTEPLEDNILLNIAIEFNLSETAFVLPLQDHTEENPHLLIRWFTPAAEVPLCGHATLASASVLFSPSSPLPISPSASLIRFETLHSGPLTAERRGEKIVLNFPAASGILEPQSFATSGEYYEIVKTAIEKAAPSLEGQVVAVTKTGFGPLVEISSAVSIEGIKVDTTFIADGIPEFLVAITQPSPSPSPSFDVYSRVFAPKVGISEDPVTGAAHTMIGPYWLSTAARTRLGNSKFASPESAKGEVLVCSQVSARGGEMDVTYQEGRVELIGSARLMMKGVISF
ncbi:hypothetical protein BCR35DRAFT_351103 [Leucosporidium creatinivorum]|uniref:Uncharacterized protein n=1 Tax=Leucosporidium creatinivorum TaxID=106004 RepID=A0A1Y2FWD0_9BASI|nr:hypothetical protein BCR35DRAFT_351103 [Leucosporidium creatinivorum]